MIGLLILVSSHLSIKETSINRQIFQYIFDYLVRVLKTWDHSLIELRRYSLRYTNITRSLVNPTKFLTTKPQCLNV